MSKIVLVGGSSEIGQAIAKKMIQKFPETYKKIIYISTTLNVDDSIHWNPQTPARIDSSLSEIKYDQGDLAIIAIGNLGNTFATEKKHPSIMDIGEIFRINFEIPLLSMVKIHLELSKAGGGKIILLTSVAGYPVLNENFYYGSSKRFLDEFGLMLNVSRENNVPISVVRSGFVPTKLNRGRSATPFSLTADKTAELVIKNLEKQIIWTPNFLKYISFLLSNSRIMRELASIKIRKSQVEN